MSLPDAPNTLREKYYSVMAGQNDADILPDIETAPSTENRYLDYIARNGGGGGGGDVSGVKGNAEETYRTGNVNITAANVGAYTKTETDTLLNGKISTTAKGVASGVAELDANGKVPSSQLPAYVDDVINGYYKIADGKFYKESTYETEITGETGKIYVSLDTDKCYRWSGLEYVEISESLALGETSSTAYAGDKGKANADAITAIKDGLTIDSFGDVETALADKVDKVTGKQLSTEDYTTAEKTKLDGLSNIKSIGYGLSLNGTSGELSATGGSGSQIQVLRSSDFSRLEYKYDASTTRYFPRITFNGHSRGKILGIKFLNPAFSIAYDIKLLYHLPNNHFFQHGDILNSGSITSYGVTITEGFDGSVHVEGTASQNAYIYIGHKISNNMLYGGYNIQNLKWYVKCFGLTGTYGSLAIDGYQSQSLEHACPVDEVQELYMYGNTNVINLHVVGGETYDCTFYPAIIPIIEDELGDLNHYEKPFVTNSNNASYVGRAILKRSIAYSSVTSDNNLSWVDGTGGNTGARGVIEYPVVHNGLNTFALMNYSRDTDATAFDFELYYVDDASTISTDENLSDIRDGIVAGRHVGLNVAGIFRTPSSGTTRYIEVQSIRYTDIIKPVGVWLSYNAEAGKHYIKSSSSTSSYTDMRDDQYIVDSSTVRYIPASSFEWSDNAYKYLRLPLGSSYLTASSSYYYNAILDYDGFDDSTEVT